MSMHVRNNFMKRLVRSAARLQRGIGMVELMVAMVLGALVVIGVIQVFTANRQTFRMQDAMAMTQESGTFAVDFIARDIERAGSEDAAHNNSDKTVNNVAFDWVNATDNLGGTGNDRLAVVYASGVTNGLFCNGEAAVSTVISNQYWVNDNNELVCQGANLVGNNFVLTGTPQVLVDNVESFQVLYGVDTRHPPTAPAACDGLSGEPTAYIRSNLVLNAITRGQLACPAATDPRVAIYAAQVVRTVRIGLLLRTPNPSGTVTDATRTYTVLDRVVGAPAIDPGDGRLRRLFTKTVLLRNAQDPANI